MCDRKEVAMQVAPKFAVRGAVPKAALDEIQERVARMEHFCDRIVACRVTYESPGRHHRHGLHRVRIVATVPRAEIVITRQSDDDPLACVREAFDAMDRRLEDYVRRYRGDVKAAVEPSIGRVARIFGDRGFGFIESKGREIYFHRNCVQGAKFDSLEPGMEVRFTEEEGEEGPQASVVFLPGRSNH
jgi:cold shock CspA family protein